MAEAQVVKVITTDDLYNEVVGLRDDINKFMSEHKDTPGRVEKLETQVTDLYKWRHLWTGAALAAGPVGAGLVKLLGG